MSYSDIINLSLSEIVGDFGYKQYANHGGIKWFGIGTSGYISVIYFLIRGLQGSQVILVNAAWDGVSAILESIVAIVFFGEYFTDKKQYLGVILISLGVFFLKIPNARKAPFVLPKLF
jgi:multidrug transporter EmrE-like cation transporter